MKNRWILITFCLLGFTFVSWLFAKNDLALMADQPWRSLSQIAALWGTLLISLTLILSTRSKKIESLFGGLDKVYTAHHFFGAAGFILIINHPLMLAIQYLPQYATSIQYLWYSNDLAYNLGVSALYVMILGFLFMVFIKLPYHWWLLSHKILGLSFLLAAAHTFLITSDISNWNVLRVWMLFWIGSGIVAVIYSVLLQKKFAPRVTYLVDHVEKRKDMLLITLSPKKGRGLHYTGGQFVYVRFLSEIVSDEEHPFSIVSDPSSRQLILGVKMLGDYTRRLSHLEPNTLAIVTGPYGYFGQQVATAGNTLWIGGGIGITPFISLAHSLSQESSPGEHTIYYCIRSEEDAVLLPELEHAIKDKPIHLIVWYSNHDGRLGVESLDQSIGLQKIGGIFMCGPRMMMDSIKNQLVSRGYNQSRIHYEDFSFIE